MAVRAARNPRIRGNTQWATAAWPWPIEGRRMPLRGYRFFGLGANRPSERASEISSEYSLASERYFSGLRRPCAPSLRAGSGAPLCAGRRSSAAPYAACGSAAGVAASRGEYLASPNFVAAGTMGSGATIARGPGGGQVRAVVRPRPEARRRLVGLVRRLAIAVRIEVRSGSGRRCRSLSRAFASSAAPTTPRSAISTRSSIPYRGATTRRIRRHSPPALSAPNQTSALPRRGRDRGFRRCGWGRRFRRRRVVLRSRNPPVARTSALQEQHALLLRIVEDGDDIIPRAG